jgi:hypothetical protein
MAAGLVWVSSTWAFKVETHRALNERAVEASDLDRYLREELGLLHGINEEFQAGTVRSWIGLGGEGEDKFNDSEWRGALARSRHHFQNPLRQWDAAGLDDRCFFVRFTGRASVRWAQLDTDQPGGSARWTDARSSFLLLLTSSSKAERDQSGSDLFRILGQQMHLISDLAVPAHVRNDSHCFPDSESFELWAGKNLSFIAGVQPIRPDPGIFAAGLPIPDPIARVPVARLWDTETYRITGNPDLTMSGQVGLAEYASANFFSRNTVFSRVFPFPAPSSVGPELETVIDPKTRKPRQYFSKVRDGQPLNRLATPGALYDYVSDALRDEGIDLDESILAEYATHLFPRAVGYSAALLDYFFRGSLEASIAPDPGDSTVLQLTGQNASAETLGDGVLKVYGDYPGDERAELGSWPLSGPIPPGGDLPGQPLAFTPPTDRPLPERYMVVYQGSLGDEKKDDPPGYKGAVIGKAARYVGIIEQLFVNQADGEVYFRNGTLVTRLEVRSQMRPGSQVSLRSWGTRNDTFLVEGAVPGESASHFYVFTLDRPQPDKVFTAPPTATLVRGPELLDVPWMHGLPLGFHGVDPLSYLATLDDNLDVILPGSYVVYFPNPYQPDLTSIHGVLLNNTTKTVLSEFSASALGAPAPGPSAQSEATPQMILRLDAAHRERTRVVVSGSQSDGDGGDWGYLGVVDGNGTEVARLVDWERSQSPYLLGRLARGGRHVLWAKFDDNDDDGSRTAIYASYVDRGTSALIGVGEADWELAAGASLMPVASDFLLRTARPTFFVRGWTPNGEVVLAPVDSPGFPPEDADFAPLKRLADPPPGVSIPAGTFCGWGYCSTWQVIEDPDLLR